MSTPSRPMTSPGPWTSRGFEHQKEQRRVILDANGAEIGYVVRGGDADLIVRAPALAADLAEAVELLYACALDDRGSCNKCGGQRVADAAGKPGDPRLEMHAESCRLRLLLARLSAESVKR